MKSNLEVDGGAHIMTTKSGKKRILEPHERSNEDLRGLTSQLWDVPDGNFSVQQRAAFAVLGTASGFFCDFITKVLNSIEIEGHENFLEIMNKSDRDNRGLLTVLNHLHYVDDPLIHVALLKMAYLDTWKSLIGDDTVFENWKWTPAEKKNFFHHRNELVRKVYRWFFGLTKTVPILRGQGIEQESFQGLIDKLQRGDWVSIFGEGTRTRVDGVLNDFKPGVGALVKGAPDSIVLPIGHDGLHKVSPMGAALEVRDPETNEVMKQIMRTGQKIHVVVGEPMDLRELAESVPDTNEGYMVIANAIREAVKPCHDRALENARMVDL